jgi:hypothetical protein
MISNNPRLPADLSRFVAITPIINSPGYMIRAENYFKFKRVCEEAGVRLVTVEAAFGARPFEVTERDNPDHVQLRTVDEFWAKENLLNIGMSHIMQMQPETREIGWYDSDQFPLSITPRQWFEETWHALQRYEIVQCWEYLINFGPDGQPISSPQMSFMKSYAQAGFRIPKGKQVKHTLAGNSGMVSLGRPGLAWAANVSALNKLGRLMDFCVLGSGDWHMAHALVGGISLEGGYSWEATRLTGYMRKMLEWQTRAERHIKRDVGYVTSTVGHWYHGNKEDRQYGSRGEILIRNEYNPETDIKYDVQGMIQLESEEPRQLVLRDQIRAYMSSRNEDSVPLR